MDYGYDGFVLEGGQPGNAPPAVRLTERWHVPLDMDVISHPDDVRRRAGILKKRLRLLCRFFESRLPAVADEHCLKPSKLLVRLRGLRCAERIGARFGRGVRIR
jgi:hypothetical protein